MEEYTIELTQTLHIMAPDAVTAVEVAMDIADIKNSYVYVDGNLWS